MDKKKLAAAMAAVYMYVRTGEEAAAAAAVPQPAAEPAAEPAKVLGPQVMANVWGMTGRQALMNGNTMMQMRMFK